MTRYVRFLTIARSCFFSPNIPAKAVLNCHLAILSPEKQLKVRLTR